MGAATAQRLNGKSDLATPTVDVLAVGCSPSATNALVVALRNAGIAVHAEPVADLEQCATLLADAPCDLLLVDLANTPEPQELTRIVREANADAAIVLLSDEPAAQLALAAEMQARDVVAASDSPRLAFIVRREFQALGVLRELAATRQRLTEAEDRCNALINAASDAVAYVHHGMHVRANPTYSRLFGFTDLAEIEDLPLMDLLAPSQRKRFKSVLRDLEHAEGITRVETLALNANGEEFPVIMEFCAAQVEGEPCTQIVVHDQRQQAATPLAATAAAEAPAAAPEAAAPAQPSLLDGATFVQGVDQRLSELDAGSQTMGLVLFELTEPGKLQNRLGSSGLAAGLQTLGAVLGELASTTQGLAGRFSEHQFGLCCPASGTGEDLLKRCLDGFTAVFNNKDLKTLLASYQLGMTVVDTAATSAGDLLQRVREQMHPLSDWQSGAVTPDTSAGTVPVVDEAMLRLIDDALENDRFRLKYQPIVSLQGDTREHYCVLLRLLDANNVELMPESFLEQAKQAQRSVAIDRWVIHNSIRELAEQRADGRKIVFFVSLSGAAIADQEFLLWVCDCLREFKAKGAWLTLQFDVEDVRRNLEAAKQLAEGLKKINCNVALDHYPRDADATALLDALPLDAVRLSPEFMTDLASNNQRQARLNEVNRMLQERGLSTVATAVEDANGLAVLWNTGVNYIQGYFLQEPSNSITYEYDG